MLRGKADKAGQKANQPAPLPLRPGTAVLKPKGAPKPDGREITLRQRGAVGAPAAPRTTMPPKAKQITPAAMIYAVAAGILFVLAVFNLFHGSIFNGIVTLVPAGSLAVLAYKYIQ